MQFKSYLQSKLPFFVALSLLFVLASCGSYQYVGSDNDGIYSSSVEIPVEETPYVDATSSNNAYYKELFAEKSKQFETISQNDNVIFTDIDSYEGNYADENGEVAYEEGYAGWGQDNQDVNIHVYNNNWGWNTIGWGVGFGWYRPWGYRNAWAWNAGWGWNHWGYGGFYDPFWPNYGYGFYGSGFYAPYYGYYGGYYGNYYNRNQVSYNAGRRGSVNAYNANRNSNVSRRGNSTLNSSRNSITRRNSTTTRRSSTLNNNTTRRNNINSRPIRRNSTINSTPTRRSTTTTRSSTPTRSSGGTMSSGSSRSSSSGGGRSSGGGGRRGG